MKYATYFKMSIELYQDKDYLELYNLKEIKSPIKGFKRIGKIKIEYGESEDDFIRNTITCIITSIIFKSPRIAQNEYISSLRRKQRGGRKTKSNGTLRYQLRHAKKSSRSDLSLSR